MIDAIERSGATVEDAIKTALDELKITEDMADIEIIDRGSAGFLGLGQKLATVKVSKKDTNQKTAIGLIDEIAKAMGINVACNVNETPFSLNIEMQGDDMGALIGRRGACLDALQYILSLAVNRGKSQYVRVNLDTENYREKREKTLRDLGMRIAKQVMRTKRSVTLEPMPNNERRIIHAALTDMAGIETKSVGEEPYRKVVVSIKR